MPCSRGRRRVLRRERQIQAVREVLGWTPTGDRLDEEMTETLGEIVDMVNGTR
jgi:hypothetical protein